MSAQTTLTEDAPMILDATCSFKHIWPAFASLRMDVRRITKPDITADAGFLPFRDRIFDRIYCDPPHLIRSDGWAYDSSNKAMDKIFSARIRSGRSKTSDFWTRYGWWPTIAQWQNFVKNTNIEFARVLKVDGILEYKITDGKDRRTTKRKDLEIMNRFTVIKERITKSKSRMGVGNKVHWLIMKPKPVGAEKA